MIDLPLAGYWLKFVRAAGGAAPEAVQGWCYTVTAGGDLAVSLTALVLLGFGVGVLVGFFGVGGGFLMTPLLNLVTHVPYNVAVGTDVTQMVGAATMANLRHAGMGYVDYKLGGLMVVGSLVGIEGGARVLELLKHAGVITLGGRALSVMQLVMTLIYAALLFWIGSLVRREAKAALTGESAAAGAVGPEGGAIVGRLRTVNLPPFISLPASGVESISLWVVLGVGAVAGFLTGLLGVSGGFIRMPALIYVLGVPTVVSIGTNLFEMLLSSLYGTLTHSLKGNVELSLVVILLITSTVGAQVGAALNKQFAGPRLQLGFALVIFCVIALMFGNLLF